MLKEGFSQWRKLDNAALAFPAVTDKKDSRVFRFYCRLKETIDGDLLQQALDLSLERYSLFQAVMRKGLFWFYLEHRDIRALVKEEEQPPCSSIYVPDEKKLLFEVTYHEKRINFEVFHALTDATGAMQFLLELVKNYLRLAHPEEEFPEISGTPDITEKDIEEDSFSQYYSADAPKNRERKQAAYQLGGGRLRQEEMEILEITMPVDQLLARARAHGVSITIFLSALLLFAIREEIPEGKLKKPVGLMIPVNLRNYFPSSSMTNFFGWIEISYRFTPETTLPEVLDSIQEQFKKQLGKEQIHSNLNQLVGLEKNPFLRIVPLEIKKYFLQMGTSLGGRSFTSIYSNMGAIRLPEQYTPHIQRFGLLASTDSMQLCSCSYGEEFVLSFTSKLLNDNIQRNLLRQLREQEISVTEERNAFPGCKKETTTGEKQAYHIFTFLCIAAAVLGWAVDFMMNRGLGWSWFVAAGCFCTWLIVSVALRKRRNLLKNGMWQLLIISAASVIWDKYTGWHGWSVDFVLPIAAMTVLCSMGVIAQVRHLELAEYLFYLVQACLFGEIPLILLLFHVVKFPYLSVICSAASFLVLVGFFIFLRKEVIQETRKKLRM